MEEAASGSQTAVKGFFIARKTQENHLLILLTAFFKNLLHFGYMLVAEGKMLGAFVERHVFHIKHEFATQRSKMG